MFIDSPREINASDPSVRSDVLAIQEDRSGAIWFGTSDGIWWYDPRADRFHPYGSTPDNPRGITHVRSMCESSSGEIWVGSNGAGLVRFDRHTTRVTRYRTLDSDLSSLSSDHVLCVLEQRDGTVWVGTEGHGLNRLRPGTRHFDRFLHDPTNPRSLSDNTVIALLEDRRGRVWAGTNGGGLDRFDPSRNAFLSYKFSPAPG